MLPFKVTPKEVASKDPDINSVQGEDEKEKTANSGGPGASSAQGMQMNTKKAETGEIKQAAPTLSTVCRPTTLCKKLQALEASVCPPSSGLPSSPNERRLSFRTQHAEASMTDAASSNQGEGQEQTVISKAANAFSIVCGEFGSDIESEDDKKGLPDIAEAAINSEMADPNDPMKSIAASQDCYCM